MRSKTPVFYKISWWMFAILVLCFIALTLLIEFVFHPQPQLLTSYIIAATILLVYTFASRQIITKDLRQGIKHLRNQRYLEAIPKFKQTYDFFNERPYLDKYRYLLLVNPSVFSYREIALLNMGYCYTLSGEVVNAKSCYQKALEEFPNSTLAKNTLRFIEAIENQREGK